MLGDISEDLIGTNPKYPKIVNHEWLEDAKKGYDNIPSENNPVRVQPELAKIWNHESNKGVNIVPNATVQPLGARTTEAKERETKTAVSDIVREAKKAAMAGINIADHLRARFSKEHLEAAQEELKKVAEEVGLLGNVYVDASAFKSYDEAEKFFKQHRNRLARDLLFNVENMNPAVVSMLASNFRKNVVSSIKYDDKLFAHYKNHLVAAGNIPSDFEINSKETLKKAFLYQGEPEKVQGEPKEDKYSSEEKKQGLEEIIKENQSKNITAQEELRWRKAYPIVEFVQSKLAEGKTATAIKEMVRSKYLLDDVKAAADFIPLVLSDRGLEKGHINEVVKTGHISEYAGEQLKKLAKEYPVKKADQFEESKSEKYIGQEGYLYAVTANNNDDNQYHEATVRALKAGFEPSKIKEKLMTAMSAVEADSVLNGALTKFNAIPAGVKANLPKKEANKPVIKDTRNKKTLPDPSTIVADSQEYIDYFKGTNTDIDIGTEKKFESSDIDMGFNMSGLDTNLSS